MALVEIVVEIQKRHSGNNLICNGFQFFSKLPLTLYVRVRILHPLPKLRNLSVAELFLGKKRRRIRMDAPPLYPRPRARF